MNCQVALDLMQRFADGELTTGQQKAFQVHLEACAVCRQALAARQELLLATAAALQQDKAPVGLAEKIAARVAQQPEPGRKVAAHSGWGNRRLGFALAGAVVLLLAVVGLWHKLPQSGQVAPDATKLPLAVIAALGPTSDSTGHQLKVGDRLAGGVTVRTGAGGRLTLVTRKGSEFTLNQNSELALGPSVAQATLQRGELYCRSREHEISRIETPAGQVRLLGTTINVAVNDKQQVAVTVVQGQVKLANGRGEVAVAAGKKALLTEVSGPQAAKQADVVVETAWYRTGETGGTEFNEISYKIRRANGAISEVWAMEPDGSNKHRVKSYIGFGLIRESDSAGFLSAQKLISRHSAPVGIPQALQGKASRFAGPGIESLSEYMPTLWFLNTATGQDMQLALPNGYKPRCAALSQAGTKLAVAGYQSVPGDDGFRKPGLFVCDFASGSYRMISTIGGIEQIAWSTDSRKLAVSLDVMNGAVPFAGAPEGSYAERLMVLDVQSGKVQDLGLTGTEPSWSPDGRKLAYVYNGNTGKYNKELWGSVFVVDIATPGSPRRIAPPTGDLYTRSHQPSWSPDGRQISYFTRSIKYLKAEDRTRMDYFVYTVRADGTGARQLYQTKII